MSGLLIASPSSGSGKTTLTLGLLRALRRRGHAPQPGKAGPDYIDPAFHSLASGEACINFDPWAMRPELLKAQAATERLMIEAMMGLFDAAADGRGAPADLAQLLDLSVVLVVDCARMSHSVGALVRGFATHRPGLRMAGIILNRIGSPRHEKMLRDGLAGIDLPILGVVPADQALALPERHLGLVQASEHAAIHSFIDHAADVVEMHVDVDRITELTRRHDSASGTLPSRILPPGQVIAVASDRAFSFTYRHLLDGWRGAGAEIRTFSPLADEAPDLLSDAIYLPGGYPELHAGTIAAAARFKAGITACAGRGAVVFGECGGYMVMGEGLIDAKGTRHQMTGLLPLVTSFAERKRKLGYRIVQPIGDAFGGRTMTAHEFHYSTIRDKGVADRLFRVQDAAGDDLGEAGLRRGRVMGSYMHLIDLAKEAVPA